MLVNPFTYGNPISEPTRFVGRQHEIEHICSRLRNLEFESSSLVGERRIGKTSLLNYLAHTDVRRAHGLDSDRYSFVYVDLQMVDQDTTPIRLWQRLLRQIARYCQHREVKRAFEEAYKSESIDTFALADIFEGVDENDQYVVLLLDEFEHVTENTNFGPDFYYGLRSLAIHHHLSLITSSRQELIELCHSEAIRSSPFFNIFANITLRPFTEAESQHLISLSLKGTSVSFTQTEIDTIFGIAGHHPYFLQIACSQLFDSYSRNLDPDERIRFLDSTFREEARPQFSDYWQSSDDQEKIVLAALALLERQSKIDSRAFSQRQLQDLYARSDQTLARLEKRGLLVFRSNTYSLFNASFGTWICQELTDTMRDRQGYEEWLSSNKGVMERLSTIGKREIGEILPRISDRYRELIINWVSDPKNLIAVIALLKGVLGLH